MENKVRIPENVLRACLPFASTDKCRESIAVIHVDAGRAIATDGHRMLVVRFANDAETCSVAPFNIGADAVKRALVACKGEASLEVSAGHVGPLANPVGEFTFPNWRNAIPRSGEVETGPEWQFEWRYMESVTDAFRILSSPAGIRVKVRNLDRVHAEFIRRENGPAYAVHQGEYPAIALVMPRRACGMNEFKVPSAEKDVRDALGI